MKPIRRPAGIVALEHGDDSVRGAPFGEDAEAASLAEAEQPLVEIGVVQRACQGGHGETHGGEGESEEFPVATMAGDEQRRLVGREQFRTRREGCELDVLLPAPGIHEAWHRQAVDQEHSEHVSNRFDREPVGFGLRGLWKRPEDVRLCAGGSFGGDLRVQRAERVRGSKILIRIDALDGGAQRAERQKLSKVSETADGVVEEVLRGGVHRGRRSEKAADRTVMSVRSAEKGRVGGAS